ncbi:hypothetical protein BJ741DRAFT_29934 [Chytriomyces cf. hyalinus JEL632]|nr:hypothetical protein BJ741DRAFT_29934 [Chytriomyces cf. hyalinus JEL632]
MIVSTRVFLCFSAYLAPSDLTVVSASWSRIFSAYSRSLSEMDTNLLALLDAVSGSFPPLPAPMLMPVTPEAMLALSLLSIESSTNVALLMAALTPSNCCDRIGSDADKCTVSKFETRAFSTAMASSRLSGEPGSRQKPGAV